jgi:hypothetical protein
MILRRLAQNLKTQNWTAITIEFVLLVLGVFLGIQVANWNQDRVDERRGRTHAIRLGNDLEQDLASRKALVSYYAAVLESVERADRLFADPLADPKQLLVAAYRASEINYRPPSRATWDEIVSSGETGLLPREAARAAAEYFASDAARTTFDRLSVSAYRRGVRRIIPLAVQNALRKGCGDVRDAGQRIVGFMPDCTLQIDPALIVSTSAALRADPNVQADLRFHHTDVYQAHFNILGLVTSIEKSLAALGARPSADRVEH